MFGDNKKSRTCAGFFWSGQKPLTLALSRREREPTYVFSNSLVISQTAANLKHPLTLALSRSERELAYVFSNSLVISQTAANLKHPLTLALSRRESELAYVFSNSLVISQAAANLKHPPISPLSLWERARVRGCAPYPRFSCMRANWRSSMEG